MRVRQVDNCNLIQRVIDRLVVDSRPLEITHNHLICNTKYKYFDRIAINLSLMVLDRFHPSIRFVAATPLHNVGSQHRIINAVTRIEQRWGTKECILYCTFKHVQ